MTDLYEDLRDGSRLSMLIELLTGEKLVGYMYTYIYDGYIHMYMYTCITQYGSTVYIGIAMVYPH